MENLTFNELPQAVSILADEVREIKRLLVDKVNEKQPEADRLLTIQEAGELLRIAVPTIYGLVSRSQIPAMKKGKRLYFSKGELTNWIKQGRKKTADEIATDTDAFLSRQKKGGKQ